MDFDNLDVGRFSYRGDRLMFGVFPTLIQVTVLIVRSARWAIVLLFQPLSYARYVRKYYSDVSINDERYKSGVRKTGGTGIFRGGAKVCRTSINRCKPVQVYESFPPYYCG